MGPRATQSPFLVVGLGASAGGLEAFFQFFDAAPYPSGMAYVLVTHLNPTLESSLAELIAAHTMMKVQVAKNGTGLKPDNIYVIPPNALIEMQGDILRVIKLPADRRMPIDHFFNSLAVEIGDNAIGIVLSGTGSDGTLGLRAIKEHGGMTIAQTPGTAKFDTMPQNAIETGYVDHVLAVPEMPARLTEYANCLVQHKDKDCIQTELEGHLTEITVILRRSTGHDFAYYKKGTLLRRIERRMLVRHAATVAEYLEQLVQTPQEVTTLFDDLLIGVTSFFRDSDAFDALAANVIPKLFENRLSPLSKEGDPVRVWVPACSSGEEAYTIAILLHEYAAAKHPGRQFQIFATDIESRALDTARRGRYPDGIANQVSAERLSRYFEKNGAVYQIIKQIREACVFSSHDLIRDPPFSRLDLISCRNLLIYLEPELQKKIIPIFHYALRPGGYLFLGPSEGVPHQNDLFVTMFERKSRIFQRRETLRRTAAELPLQVGPFPVHPMALDPKSRPAHEAGMTRILERIVLDQCTSACAFIDEKGEVLFLAGNTDKYLHRPVGPPSNNIIDIARKSVRLDLRAAIGDARRTKSTVVRQDINVETADGIQCINLMVRPAPEAGAAAGLYLVRFQEVSSPKTLDQATAGGRSSRPDEPLVQHLEDELKSTREKLEASVGELEHANEDLRSSNEEVLSMNEELQSSNEELQTSKEELQSINEELETVNTELTHKVVALLKANNDSKNLFESTQLATIFLDKKLCIGKFTPAAKKLFNLLDTDIARPITDFAPRFIGANLVADAHEVLKTLTPLERPVQSIDRKSWYMMKVLPYRTLEDAIEGVVITFHDVTELRKTQRQRDAIIDSSQDAIVAGTLDGVITTWNPAAQRLYGYAAEEAVGRSISLIIPAERIEEERAMAERIRKGEFIEPFDTLNLTKNRNVLHVRVSISPIRDEAGTVVGASSIRSDISARKHAESAARNSSILLRAVIETATDGIITIDENGIVRTANPAAERIFKYGSSQIKGAQFSKLLSDHRMSHKDLASGSSGFGKEVQGVRRDGTPFPMEVSVSQATTDAGLIYTAFVRDITQRKLAEESLRLSSVLKESELRFRQLAELIPQIVWTAHADGAIDFINSKWLQYTASAADADHTRTWEAALYPEDAKRVKKVWRSVLETGQDFDSEMRLRRHDGQYRWHVSRANPLHDANGKIARWFGSFTDIHDQKTAQESLLTADKQKDEFLAILGHELRNPLAPVRTAAHVLQHELKDMPKLKRACDIIQRQTMHMTRIIDDLLDITRISKGKIVLRKEQVDLNDLVRRTTDDYRDELKASGATLTLHPASEPLWITADPTRICQVIGNVLHNAKKFTGEGGKITVQLSATPRTDSAWAELIIRDTGIGMTQETITSIFEPFKQADHSIARAQGGLGLGLAMVKGIVEMHGGRVAATSKGLGYGSEITIQIPLERHRKPVEAAPTPRVKSTPHRLLIVEDNVDSAEMMRMLLEMEGHYVAVAYTAAKGLSAAHAHDPDIVLCDIGLPGDMDGYAFAKTLRADPKLRSKKLVALTGYGLATDQQRALDAGFDLHLTKPVDPAALIELIGSLPAVTT